MVLLERSAELYEVSVIYDSRNSMVLLESIKSV